MINPYPVQYSTVQCLSVYWSTGSGGSGYWMTGLLLVTGIILDRLGGLQGQGIRVLLCPQGAGNQF